MKIVNVKLLKQSPLWAGSVEEGYYQYGGLPLQYVLEKIEALKRADDLTEKEKEYLFLLERTAANPANPTMED